MRLPFLRRRARGPEHYPEGPLRSLAASPPPADTTPVSEVELLALDVETTGLDPASDHLLSLGWVPVVGRRVVLAEARELRVRPPEGVDVGASATLHRLTDDDLSDAAPLPEALPPLLEALHGRVLLAHHASLEVEFVAAAARTSY
ncbi:MAG TPA: exonuclease domain-containing protein, partial [Pedococcus sp.]